MRRRIVLLLTLLGNAGLAAVIASLIQRPGGEYRGAPVGRTRIRPGDTLIVYGRGEAVCELDERPCRRRR